MRDESIWVQPRDCQQSRCEHRKMTGRAAETTPPLIKDRAVSVPQPAHVSLGGADLAAVDLRSKAQGAQRLPDVLCLGGDVDEHQCLRVAYHEGGTLGKTSHECIVTWRLPDIRQSNARAILQITTTYRTIKRQQT